MGDHPGSSRSYRVLIRGRRRVRGRERLGDAALLALKRKEG
jgi:hypothetical protein